MKLWAMGHCSSDGPPRAFGKHGGFRRSAQFQVHSKEVRRIVTARTVRGTLRGSHTSGAEGRATNLIVSKYHRRNQGIFRRLRMSRARRRERCPSKAAINLSIRSG